MKRFLHLLSNALPLCAALLACLPAKAQTGSISISDDYSTVTITNSVSNAITSTDKFHSTNLDYTDIADAVDDSNIAGLLKSLKSIYGDVSNSTYNSDEYYGWKDIKKLIITGESKLNFADFIVINWLANMDKLYEHGKTMSSRTTNGSLTTLELGEDVRFVVDGLINCEFYYDYSYDNSEGKYKNICTPYNSIISDPATFYNPMKETDLPGGAFAGTKLTSIKLPTALTGIGARAFRATSIQEMDLRNCDNLTQIGNGAFGYCTSLTNVVLPRKDMDFYGGAFTNCTNLETVYINSKITEKTGSTTNFNNCTNAKLYVPMSLMDYYRETDASFKDYSSQYYPTLESGKLWRSFSFDRDLDYSGNIYSLFNTSEYLQARIVSAYDKNKRTFTVSNAGQYPSSEGVLIYGEGVANEFYPVPAASTTSDPTNFLKGSGHGTLSVPTHGSSTTNFILKNGDFYYSTGGTLAMYKSYLQLPENIEVASDKNSAKGFTMIFDNTTGISDINASPTAAANGAIYNLQGVRVASGDDAAASLPAGVYIKNGRKFIVK